MLVPSCFLYPEQNYVDYLKTQFTILAYVQTILNENNYYRTSGVCLDGRIGREDELVINEFKMQPPNKPA
jgi:hypothetical protein